MSKNRGGQGENDPHRYPGEAKKGKMSVDGPIKVDPNQGAPVLKKHGGAEGGV